MSVKDVEDMQKNLKEFYNRNKKAVIIGGAVAVVTIGLGASLIFNQSPANNNESGALNNPTAVSSAAEKKNVVREDVPISTLSSFTVYSPFEVLEGYDNVSDVTEDRVVGEYRIEGSDGTFLKTDNDYIENVDPVCAVNFSQEKPDGYSMMGSALSLGGDVSEIAKNYNATIGMNYRGKIDNPPTEERVTDIKIQSLDGTKNYLIPTVRFTSPNNGHIVYFGAAKLLNGDYAVLHTFCQDQHGDGKGFGEAEALPEDVYDKNWKILDTIRIRPTE